MTFDPAATATTAQAAAVGNVTTTTAQNAAAQPADRYQDVGGLQSGYNALYGHTRTVEAENAAMRQRLDAAQALLEQLAAGGGQPAGPAAPQSNIAKLAESMNVDPSLLASAIAEEADRRAAQAVERWSTPISLGMKARETLAASRPDYLQREPVIAQVLRNDPDLKNAVDTALQSGNEKLATRMLDYAYLKAAEGGWNAGASQGVAPRVGADGGQQLDARIDAMLPGGPVGQSRQQATSTDRMSRMAQLATNADNTGRWTTRDKDEFLNLYLQGGGHVPDEHVR